MFEAFRMGGWAMMPTALFGTLLVVAAARWAIRPDSRLVPLQLALAILTMSTGALGFVTGLIVSTTRLGELPPNKIAAIAAAGFGESLCGVALALTMVSIAAGVGTLGALRRVQYA